MYDLLIEEEGEVMVSPAAKRRKSSTGKQETSQQQHQQQQSNIDEVHKKGGNGFVVRCQNNKEVFITSERATFLQEKCGSLKDAFRHESSECQTGIISKPDWTEEILFCILSLLEKGTCEIPSDYKRLKIASAQIAISLHIRHPIINGCNIAGDDVAVQLLSKRWKATKSAFVIETPLFTKNVDDFPTKWQALFDSGIVVLRHKNSLLVTVDETNRTNNYEKEDGFAYCVGSSAPLCISIFHTCFYLRGSTCTVSFSPKEDNDGCFQIFFQTNFGSGSYLSNALKHVKYFRSKVSELVSITGSAKLLQKSLGFIEDFIIPTNDTKLCMLQISNPSSLILGKFISAIQQCVNESSSNSRTVCKQAALGWKSEENSFYSIKASKDVGTVLALLADPSTEAAKIGPFLLRDHSLSRGWDAF